MAGWRRRIVDGPHATVDERLRAVFRRLVYGVLVVASFALGSLGAFLALDWPPLLQEFVGAGLFVVLVARTTAALGRRRSRRWASRSGRSWPARASSASP